MKNKLKIFGLVLVLTALAIVAHVHNAKAASHRTVSLVTGQNIALSNNVTITNLQFGLYYIAPRLTNVIALSTNATGGIEPSAFVPVSGELWADAIGQPTSNMVFGVQLNATNIIDSVNQNVAITTNMTNLFTPSSASTNTVTFTLQRSCSGTNWGSTTQDKFTLAVNAGGVAGITVYTNLPTSFTAGIKAVRILSVVASDATSPGVIINWVGLSGWAP